MPSCKKELVLTDENNNKIIIYCLDGEGHQGNHEARAFAENLYNEARGEKGKFIIVKF